MAKVSGPMQPSVHWVLGFFLRLKRTGHHVDHLLSSSARFKNEWSYIHTPVVFSGKEVDKYTQIKYGISFFSSPGGLM